MTQKEFIEKVGPVIRAEALRRGYHYPSAIIAQACLESNYGKSSLASKYFNLFGMKCGGAWTGKSVNLQTKEEYTAGTLTTIRDNFRAYDTLEDGIKGYFDFISTRRYMSLKSATSPRDYLEKIKACGYATASKYVDSNMKVIETKNLESFDGVATPVVTPDKSIEEVAKDVIAGKYGNGAARMTRLRQAGYKYIEVQRAVNDLLRKG